MAFYQVFRGKVFETLGEVQYNYISPDTTTTPGTTMSTADVCNDGDNGGCSHQCSNNKCQCPDCWELEDNKKTCAPV